MFAAIAWGHNVKIRLLALNMWDNINVNKTLDDMTL